MVRAMYEDHPHFEKPADDCRIWRYIDFTKFAALLLNEALYFPSVDCLRLDDAFEGTYSDVRVLLAANELLLQPGDTVPSLEDNLKSRELAKNFGKVMYVNCWHINDDESAMWKLYLKSDEGVAVQSTFGGLRECLSRAAQSVSIGKVRYIDHSREIVPENSIYFPFMHKRSIYKHEQELRALWWDASFTQAPFWSSSMPWPTDRKFAPGVNIPVRLEALIEQVVVAPRSPGWFQTLVKDLLKERGLSKEVRRSTSEDAPLD
jgi:hypothetical protein